MDQIEKELFAYGLNYTESDLEDRKPIDFMIDDSLGNGALVWGNIDDVEWECNHPVTVYYNDETRGECPVCGALCDWHFVEEEDGKLGREPHDWYTPMKPHGIIEKILNEEKKKWQS